MYAKHTHYPFLIAANHYLRLKTILNAQAYL